MIPVGAIVVDRHGRQGTVIEVVRDYARVERDGECHWYACAALTVVALGGLFGDDVLPGSGADHTGAGDDPAA